MFETKINRTGFGFLATILIVATIILFTPLNTNAYFTTAQNQIDLGNGTGLFLIEYKFGMKKYDVHIPVTAMTNVKQNDVVSYEMLNKNGDVAMGESVGIVLSDATINENGIYVVPKGTSATFTLVVFFTPEKSEDLNRYKLQVTNLPFQFDGTQQLQLNPSELKYYITRSLKL